MTQAPIYFQRHAIRLALLICLSTVILGWTAARSSVVWADGLRYIAQAREFDEGLSKDKLTRAVDHPVYPLLISAAHRVIGGTDPASWQHAAQAVSVISALLLLVPLYLMALEIVGETGAWLGILLVVLLPTVTHTFADALCESTFLLFWTWGIWLALRFLRQGKASWLIPVVGASVLAYLTRPEGLLLPASLVATLGLMLFVPSIRLPWPRWWLAVTLLVIGPVVAATPFIVMRGGIGTKPAVARLFGLAPSSPGMAIERDRPVSDQQTITETYTLAVRAMFRALTEAVTLPLLVLAPFGLLIVRGSAPTRARVMVGIILVCWILALVRLHATGGYCTPRHALIAALLLIISGSEGLARLLQIGLVRLEKSGRILPIRLRRVELMSLSLLIFAFAAFSALKSRQPLNEGFAAYRQAGEWLATHSEPDSKVVDLKGWALFYGQKSGYGFSRIGEGFNDKDLRWVVAHDSLLAGPWFYCQFLREMLQGRRPVASFPSVPTRGIARVHVYDLAQAPITDGKRAALATDGGTTPQRR